MPIVKIRIMTIMIIMIIIIIIRNNIEEETDSYTNGQDNQSTSTDEFSITNKNNDFRIIRKFTTKCTDSYLWTYNGIIKFLKFMREFEDYSSPFDYYMCNFFELELSFKHYWSVKEFFKQGSNLGLINSTIQN